MSQTKRAYDKFLLYALLIIALGVVGFISATTVIDPSYINTTGPILGSTGTFSGALTGTTLDTGQGANELFDMDQNVLQASAVTFATVDTGQGANELFDMNQNVQTTSAVTFVTVNTGQGANDLWDMDQNVMTTSSVTFDDVTVSDDFTLGGVTRSAWPATGAGITIETVICVVEGSDYVAYFSNGSTLMSSASAYNTLQAAMDYVTFNSLGVTTWGVDRVNNYAAIKIGPGLWNLGANTLQVPNKVSITGSGQGATRITGTQSPVIQNMWSNYTYGVVISDISLSGAVARIVEWSVTAATTPAGDGYWYGMLKLHNINFKDSTQYSVYAKSTSGNNPNLEFSNVRGSGQGWYFSRIFDSSFHSSSMGTLTLTAGCTANWFSGLYVGGGTTYSVQFTGDASMWSNYGNIFEGCRFDNPLQTWVNFAGYAQGNVFSGCIFSNINQAATDSTYSGIIHGADTHHNTITGSHFSNDLESADAAILKYVIEEKAGTHNNTWVGNSFEDNTYSSIPLWDKAIGAIYYSTDYNVSNFEVNFGSRHGTSEASNDDWIAHTLPAYFNLGMDNCTITLTVSESDAPYAAQIKAVNGTHFQLYLYDIAAATTEAVDKTIDWQASYEP